MHGIYSNAVLRTTTGRATGCGRNPGIGALEKSFLLRCIDLFSLVKSDQLPNCLERRGKSYFPTVAAVPLCNQVQLGYGTRLSYRSVFKGYLVLSDDRPNWHKLCC